MTTDLAAIEKRDKLVDALERAIRTELVPVVFELKHHFSEGVYARELHIPAGTVLTGRVHLRENLNILSKGRMILFMEDGSRRTVEAPYTVVSPPGTRRAAFASTDCVWTTILATELTDPEEIEKEFTMLAEEYRAMLLSEQDKLRIEGSL